MTARGRAGRPHRRPGPRARRDPPDPRPKDDMTIDLTPDPHVADLAARTAAFVRAVVAPEEQRLAGVASAGGEELRAHLQQAARDAGVFAPHVPRSTAAAGWTCVVGPSSSRRPGWSLLGPLALNCAAPDEGNMHLLEAVATDEQKERYLRPLAAGEVRSCFAMTEPAPGAGSDPATLSTTATPTTGGWLINGRKWFITGADGAAFTICMARTSGQPGDRGGATMFLVDAGHPRYAGRPPHRHARPGLVRRALRGRVRRRLRPGGGSPRRGRPGLRIRPGPAGPGPADPLHALARHRPARPGHRRRPGARSASCSAPGWATSAWSRRWSPTPRSTSRRPGC